MAAADIRPGRSPAQMRVEVEQAGYIVIQIYCIKKRLTSDVTKQRSIAGRFRPWPIVEGPHQRRLGGAGVAPCGTVYLLFRICSSTINFSCKPPQGVIKPISDIVKIC